MNVAAFYEATCLGPSPEYREKQLHPVPDVPLVDRVQFLIERCRGKAVLDIGASGPMHAKIVSVAAKCWGIDRVGNGAEVIECNIDNPHGDLPRWDDDQRLQLVVCGEVIEHLSNPGSFLKRLREKYRGVPVIITVPNAFSDSGRKQMERGVENCNRDHVAWYSPRTIRTLVEREGYAIREFYWYGHEGQRPKFSEGLIVVVE